MSALTSAISEEIETIREDIARAEASGSDASTFKKRLNELTKRLREANEQLDNKQVLKG